MAATIRILALGDSLTAGYGLAAEAAFPARLEQALRAEGRDVRVINAGVSGDTTAGGLARLDWSLADKPDFAIVELGANDGLRGLPPALMQSNLDEIIVRAKKSSAKIVLLGMRIPPNYGKRFNDLFEAVFPALAARHHAAYVPFLLEGVGGNAKLMQPDGLHPNDEAQPVLMRLVWEKLEPLL